MDKFRFLIYGILLTLTFQTTDVLAALTCRPLDEVIKSTLTEEHLALAAVGTLDNGIAIMIFADDKGKFKIVGVDDKFQACTLLSGVDLRAPWEIDI